MAGAGYRLFNTGDVLTAAQVNNYLQEQVIMVFANSSARTSALSGVLAEGMASYLQDTNSFEIYNGSAWVSASGDLTGLTAGTGITITDPTGPVPTITNDVATEFDTKGDLIVGTGADTFDKLVAGNSGETLVADSAATTGLRYQPTQAAGRNGIINGGFDIWQRGTSFTAADVYTTDRWKKDSQTYSTISRQTTSDTTNLPTIQYCTRVARNNGQTGTSSLGIIYSAETADSLRFAGQAVVVSFYARAGANYSAASSNISYNFYTGTGTDQSRSFGVQFTGEANIASSTKTLTTTWQRFSFTATVGATATELALMFFFAGVGTAGANDYFEITGVQLELGSVATAFSRAGGTIQGELAACQRYYNTNTFAFRLITQANAGAAYAFTTYLPQMRPTPTLAFTSAASATANITGTPTLDVLTSDGSTYIARMNYTATSANTDTYYVRSFSASAEL